MKQLRHLFLLASMAFFAFSCQKELSNESGNPVTGNSQWEFTQGAKFNGSVDTAFLSSAGTIQSLLVSGTSADGKGQIEIEIVGTGITATSYKNPNVAFEYVQNGATLYSNNPSVVDAFTVVITSIDANSVTGTFSGQVEDSVGNPQVITNGKFSAVLKTPTTPPLQGICKISNIGFFDLRGGPGLASYTNSFTASNQISKVQLIDSSTNPASLFDAFNLTYTNGRVNIDNEQYFELDANGRIKSFVGYQGLQKDSVGILIFTYTFNANGNLTKTTFALKSDPTVVGLEINNTWTNGNLTRVSIVTPGVKRGFQYDFEYDLTKTVKEFINMFPNTELFYPQTAINYGKNSVNVPVKSTISDINDQGTVEDTSTATYTNYVIDANGYVKSFDVKGEGTPLVFTDIKYVLSYKCF